MNILLLCLVLFLPQDIQQLEDKANKAIDQAERQILKIDPDDPVIEKCPCDGKGYIIHGDGHRTSCPGTSDGPCKFKGSSNYFGLNITEVDLENKSIIINGILYKLVPAGETVDDIVKSDKPVVNGVVEIYTAEWCAPCQKLKVNTYFNDFVSNLKKAGWTVKEVLVDKNDRVEMGLPYVNVIMKNESNLAPVYKNDGSLFFNLNFIENINRKYSIIKR